MAGRAAGVSAGGVFALFVWVLVYDARWQDACYFTIVGAVLGHSAWTDTTIKYLLLQWGLNFVDCCPLTGAPHQHTRHTPTAALQHTPTAAP